MIDNFAWGGGGPTFYSVAGTPMSAYGNTDLRSALYGATSSDAMQSIFS